MAEETDRIRRERDMVLAPNEFMYVQDETKGHVDVFAGPTKQSLSGSDTPVLFDDKAKRFIKQDDYRRATQLARTAPEGWYIVLKNPAKDGKHPSGQGKLSSAELEIGRKVNIPGPCSFALWPGQMAKVIKGHHLRSNQYLLVRVYDADAARQNWKKAVVQPAGAGTGSDSGASTGEPKGDQGKAEEFSTVTSGSLTMGQLMIIKGTDVSFYIPPTGMEVVPDDSAQLVRNAVTLARLEYCLLLDEGGNKRYEQGPAVVFPEPTEAFVEREVDGEGGKTKTRKFRAIELNASSGIYVKVIADYKDEVTGMEHKTGDELFITGKDTTIYFPREEHALIKYGSSEVHYGLAIPAGEARYVLNRNTGDIRKVVGATVFLPDPRSEVILRRILDFKTCNLLFPNNIAAFQHNASLMGVDLETYMTEHPQSVAGIGLAAAAFAGALGATGPQGPVRTRGFAGAAGADYQAAAHTITTNAAFMVGDSLESRGLGNAPGRGMVGDQFQRKNQFTAPRMLTLDSKFDGVIAVDIWVGYAMMLVQKSGDRQVVKGPQTVLLDYDESPQVLTLSRGKPKTTDSLLRTAFLLTQANKVSDVVEVETADFCRLSVKLSYRVNFEGDESKWFNVENYVKFLCDHMRSRVRSAVQKIGIEEFYGNHTDLLRDIILGKSTESADGKSSRPGTSFAENGMKIYDVEVLDVKLQNHEVEKLLVQTQQKVIQETLLLASEKRKLLYTRESEAVKQELAEISADTRRKQMTLEAEEATRKLERDLIIIEANAKAESERLTKELETTKARAVIGQVEIDQRVKAKQTEIALDKEAQAVKLAAIAAEVSAAVEKGKAFSPDLIAALNSFGEKELIERVSKSMAPLAILGGESVQEVLAKLLSGTKLAEHLLPPKNGSSNATARA